MNLKKIFLSIAGWYGMLALVSAYALLSFGIIQDDLRFHFLNGSGALGLFVHEAAQKDYAPAVLNLIWLAVATISFLKALSYGVV